MRPPRPALTHKLIKAAELKDTTYPIPDGGMRGLYLQVTPAGAKSWVLRYRHLGKQKTSTVGSWPALTVEEARAKARRMLTDLANGIDPNQKKADARSAERGAITVEALAARFEAEHLARVNKKSTQMVNGRYLKADIIPALGKMKVKAVTKADIAAFLYGIQEQGKTGKAYTLSRILSKMFAKAELWGFRPEGTNPARGQECPQPTKRARRLTDSELARLGRVLHESAENPYAIRAIRLYLLTGMRRSELLGDQRLDIEPLTWDGPNYVDLARGIVHLEKHKTASKAGPRDLIICEAARAELMALKEANLLGNPCVIPGTEPMKPLVNLSAIWDRIRAKAEIPDVRVHDLRRTFTSMGADLGLPDYFADAQTGHAAATVTDTYRRVGLNPLRDAVEAIGARISQLLNGHLDPQDAEP